MSKEADEIANRIFEACSPKSRFHRDMVTAMHKAEIKTGDGYEIISSSIADQLIKLGYVKVVPCKECKKRPRCTALISPSNGSTKIVEIKYCSEGARVAGEEGKE